MAAKQTQMIRVGSLAELQQAGVKVVEGADRSIAVFARDSRLFAVDNRCPHMGFPLHRGTLEAGILTCHWHHARFEASSGCTFDLFADDVPTFATEVRDQQVFVAPYPRQAGGKAFHFRRLQRGMEQSVSLVQAKSLLGALTHHATLAELLSPVVDYAAANLNTWTEGLVRLTCVANLYPHLEKETRYLALFYAVRQIAAECSTSVPRREKGALDGAEVTLDTLEGWLVQWVRTRHPDAAERTILTGVSTGASLSELNGLVIAAAAERLYADTGHLLDAANKALELLDHAGWSSAGALLPLLAPRLAGSRGQEESTPWHYPVELVAPLRALEPRLPQLLAAPRDAGWAMDQALVDLLLGEDGPGIISGLEQRLGQGAPAEALSAAVAYAAALRLTHFAESNEVGDWFSAQHTFIFASAVNRAIRRGATPQVVRALFQAAVAVYSDRFLNVPPARLPGPSQTAGLPTDAEGLLALLKLVWDQRSYIGRAAAVVGAYLDAGHPVPPLLDALAFATVREDLDFHSLQVLEAAADLVEQLGPGAESRRVLIGVARNLAAHCPTRRAAYQTAQIAGRLHRGEEVFAEA